MTFEGAQLFLGAYIPQLQRAVMTRADQRFAVRQEGYPVDWAHMGFECAQLLRCIHNPITSRRPHLIRASQRLPVRRESHRANNGLVSCEGT